MRRTLALLGSALPSALIAALVVVVADVPAEGAPNGGGPGGPLLLSRVNQAGPMTVLKTNGAFRILAKNPKRPPLMAYTPDSMPPLDVSSTARVDNLKADLLDGIDSTAFAEGTRLIAARAGGSQLEPVISTSEIVRSVPPTAGDGTVIVTSTAVVPTPNAGDGVKCSITTGTDVDHDYAQLWSSAGSAGEWGQPAGDRSSAPAVRTDTSNTPCCLLAGESARWR